MDGRYSGLNHGLNAHLKSLIRSCTELKHQRINLAELKAQIVKKVGPDRSEQYFHFLNKLLSLRLSKVEFERLCLKLLGKEHVSLHNELIRSILQNAVNGTEPPPKDSSLSGGSALSEIARCSSSSHGSQKSRAWCSETCQGGGLLPDTDTLREHMGKIAAEVCGLEGVSVECTNLLNHGLNAHLKSLIRSCTELKRARTGRSSKVGSKDQKKLVNGMVPISMLDFRAAMELRPQQLGENWPLLLEKIQHSETT